MINRYLGYWDGNPATLIPLSPQDSAPLYVEMMGGAGADHGEGPGAATTAGEYRLAHRDPQQARLCASPATRPPRTCSPTRSSRSATRRRAPSLRNSFLAAALELRSGIPGGMPPRSSGPDMIRGLSTGLWLDYLGIRLDSRKADGHAVRDEPRDARQRRAVCRGIEQRDLDQHQGIRRRKSRTSRSRSTVRTSRR